jgi:cytochrome c-type biogenesis protein CcmF
MLASFNADLGHFALVVGLTASVAGVVAMVAGVRSHNPTWTRTGKRYAWTVFAMAVLAFGALERALITRDFSMKYVQEVGGRGTPALYNFTAAWSALEGSILLWLLVLSGFIAAVAWRYRTRMDDPLVAWALAVLFIIASFFFLLTLLPADPFKAGVPGVTDGPGPNPLLQDHPLVLFHPPSLYLGYVGMSVPFAFAMAALITGRVGEGWLLETRRWTLMSWGFLTVGIILGGWWAYEVLGWGGVWGWDPVENASFLPWLTGTAFIHSVLVQERRGMLRVWNLSLLVATFSLTILGTFLTRSGVLNSVHAFSESDIGPFILTFFAIVVISSIVLIGWRGDRLRSPGAIDSPVSREGAFLANNVLFGVFAFIVLLGTVFPLVIDAVQHRQVKVGAPYYDRLTAPLGLCILTLMAIAPVLPWRKASQELLRDRLFWPAWCGAGALAVSVAVGANGIQSLLAFGLGGFAAGSALRQLVLATRRQGLRGLVGRANGGMIVHLGIIMIAVALTASNAYSHTQRFVMNKGDTAQFAGHTFQYLGVSEETDSRRVTLKAGIKVDDDSVYAPALSRYTQSGMQVGTPSVKSGPVNDIYLTLDEVQSDGSVATIRVAIKPLIVWVWTGGAIVVLGTLLAAFPGKHRRRPTDAVSAPVPVAAGPPSAEPQAVTGG